MTHERTVLGAGTIIVLVGVLSNLNTDTPPWRRLAGGIGFIVLLSMLSAAGEGAAKIAAGLAAVTAMGVVMYEGVGLVTGKEST